MNQNLLLILSIVMVIFLLRNGLKTNNILLSLIVASMSLMCMKSRDPKNKVNEICLLVSIYFGSVLLAKVMALNEQFEDTQVIVDQETANEASNNLEVATNTDTPAGTTQAPAGTTQAPAGTTQAPAGTTQAPAGTTQLPNEPVPKDEPRNRFTLVDIHPACLLSSVHYRRLIRSQPWYKNTHASKALLNLNKYAISRKLLETTTKNGVAMIYGSIEEKIDNKSYFWYSYWVHSSNGNVLKQDDLTLSQNYLAASQEDKKERFNAILQGRGPPTNFLFLLQGHDIEKPSSEYCTDDSIKHTNIWLNKPLITLHTLTI